jgi:hypothetical protein
MDEFNELEYKYKADNIGLQDFVNLMKTLPTGKRLDISSWDLYYTKNEEDFVRFRNSDTPELTKKVKTKDNNNWVRVEVDLPLDPSRITEETVTKYLELEGYKENFRVYKSCFIFWTNAVNYVYYIVYDSNMKESGRFIEVEINKNKILELNIKMNNGAIWELNQAATELQKIGLNPNNRMKKSLFEIYRK